MRRPIAEYYQLEPLPDVVVGDDDGNAAEAGWCEADGWVDLADPEQIVFPKLGFVPTWFGVIPSRAIQPDWLSINIAPRNGAEILVSGAGQVAMAIWDGMWIYSTGNRLVWEGADEDGDAAFLAFEPTHWLPKPAAAPEELPPRDAAPNRISRAEWSRRFK